MIFKISSSCSQSPSDGTVSPLGAENKLNSFKIVLNSMPSRVEFTSEYVIIGCQRNQYSAVPYEALATGKIKATHVS